LINDIIKPVRAGRQLRRRLPGWGLIHIDRHLPFLCVYRRPENRDDLGTERLLTGEASYLMARGDPAEQSMLSQLVFEIAALQSEACGSFLLVEIWSKSEAGRSGNYENTLPVPFFRIIAPLRNAPVSIIERLEQALLKVYLRKQRAQVMVDYTKKCAPPGMKPILSGTQIRELSCYLIGLEISPVYRDEMSDDLLPFALRAIRQGLDRALKQTLYEFSRMYSKQKPMHYHELGRRAMTRAVFETDKQLAAIDNQFDLILQATPVNVSSAWHEFRRKRFAAAPELHYRPRTIDPSQVKRALYNIPLEHIEDPTLAHLFEEKRKELDRKVSMLDARGKQAFLYGSMQVFGVADDKLMESAAVILDQIPPHTHDDRQSHALDAHAFAQRAEAELAHYQKYHSSLPATVQIRNDISGLIVSQGHFLIGTDVKVGENRVEASIQHEVGVHLVTYYNGLIQPLHQLHVGLAAYDETQEGLAVLAEYLAGGLNRSRIRTLAARVIAVHHLTNGADFVETFRTLHNQYHFNQYQAYYTTMRVFRGGGLTKDVVYLRGLIDLLDYFAKGGAMEPLLVGKFSLQQAPFIEELRWRKVLQPPLIRPRFLEQQSCLNRFSNLQAGLTLSSLVKGLAV